MGCESLGLKFDLGAIGVVVVKLQCQLVAAGFPLLLLACKVVPFPAEAVQLDVGVLWARLHMLQVRRPA